MTLKDRHKYDDIIRLPHHVSDRHPQMSPANRAAQFSPFAALTGYDDSVREAARWTDEKIELGDVRTEAVNKRLNFLVEHLSEIPYVVITYFIPDAKKAGGSYQTAEGQLKKIDEYGHRIVFTDKRMISFDDILNIECDLFPDDLE